MGSSFLWICYSYVIPLFLVDFLILLLFSFLVDLLFFCFLWTCHSYFVLQLTVGSIAVIRDTIFSHDNDGYFIVRVIIVIIMS